MKWVNLDSAVRLVSTGDNLFFCVGQRERCGGA